MLKRSLYISLICCFVCCTNTSKERANTLKDTTKIVRYAKGFTIEKHEGYSVLTVHKPWPNATKSFQYLLLEKSADIPKNVQHDALVRVPVETIIVTSTTHIPALELLDELDKLIGFPNTEYISSPVAREQIEKGEIKELGKNENMSIETVIDLQPDVLVSFGINGQNKTLEAIQKAKIPVLYNSEWIEQHALGRAEWIHFFGALFNKEAQAAEVFNQIEKDYNTARNLAKTAQNVPTVFSGMPYKDTWYIPYGNSWASQFIRDANGNYLWEDSKGKGSMTLNFESVLEQAKTADYWIAIGDYQTKSQLVKSNAHYQEFNVFAKNGIFMANKKGKSKGLLFYEQAPSRPDLVLKDLIKIFHPTLLPEYEPYFYTQLK